MFDGAWSTAWGEGGGRVSGVPPPAEGHRDVGHAYRCLPDRETGRVREIPRETYRVKERERVSKSESVKERERERERESAPDCRPPGGRHLWRVGVSVEDLRCILHVRWCMVDGVGCRCRCVTRCTSIYHNSSGSTDVTTHLDHISYCK